MSESRGVPLTNLDDPLFDDDLGLRKRVFDCILRHVRQIPGQIVDLVRVGLGAIGVQGGHDVDGAPGEQSEPERSGDS